MSSQQQFERRVRAWLEQGPTDPPERAVEAALAEVDATTQERDLGIPWRFPTMNVPTRFLTATMAIIVVVIGGAALLSRTAPSGVGSASSPPSPTASGSPSLTQSFTSALYGYSIRYPADWTVTDAKVALTAGVIPSDQSEASDVIRKDQFTVVTIAAQPVDSGTTPERWATTVKDLLPKAFSMLGNCVPTPHTLTVAGEAATLLSYKCQGNNLLWVTLVHGGLGYHIAWNEPATDPLAARDRFDPFLASFAFTK